MIYLVVKTTTAFSERYQGGQRIKLERSELHDGYMYAWTSEDNLTAVIDWYNTEDNLLWFRHGLDEPPNQTKSQ